PHHHYPYSPSHTYLSLTHFRSFFFITRPPPTSTLFPYTTLFRSPRFGYRYRRRPLRTGHRAPRNAFPETVVGILACRALVARPPMPRKTGARGGSRRNWRTACRPHDTYPNWRTPGP